MAPEALCSHQHAPKCEIWSFAVILWEIVTLGNIIGLKHSIKHDNKFEFRLGATPYVDVRGKELVQRIQRGLRLKQPSNCHFPLYQVGL